MKSLAPALAIVLLTSIAVAGDLVPAPPVKPPAKGDRCSVEWRERLTQHLERTQDGAPPRSIDSTETSEATWTQEVVEVRGGRAALVRVTVEGWQRTSGSTTDTLAAPRVVRVKPIERVWELEVVEPALSGATRRFLDRLTERLAGSGSIAAVQSAVLPAAPTAQGATWSVAIPAVEPIMLGAPFTKVDARRSSVTARLATLEPRAQVLLEGTLQLINAPGTDDRFTEGGVCTINVDATWKPGERPGVGGTVVQRQKVEGATAGQFPDGTPYRTKMSLEYELRTSEQ